MNTLNEIKLIGSLGQEPEVRKTKNDTTVANISIATNERYKENGEWAKRTEWHRVVMFGNDADNAGKYLKKGSKVYVNGRLSTRKWTDKNNVDRYTTEIMANHVIYLDKKDSGTELQNQNVQESAISDNDIPF